MIDVENDVFDRVYGAMEYLLPEGCFSAEYNPVPPALPFATLIEMDNYTDTAKRGTADDEEFGILMYETNVYAESKAECRQITNALDSAMTRLGFHRLSLRPVDNLNDHTIHRMVGRYRAEVNQHKTVFRY